MDQGNSPEAVKTELVVVSVGYFHPSSLQHQLTARPDAFRFEKSKIRLKIYFFRPASPFVVVDPF